MCAWDASQPTDGTKLRLGPGLIRANWSALETGGVPFDALQLQEQAVDPASAANTGFLYGKASGGSTEAFFENSAGLIKQLTGLPITTAAINGGFKNGVTTPWGLIINWGWGRLNPTTLAITWAIPFTSYPAITAVKLKASVDTTANLTVGNEDQNGCTFYGATNDGFGFIAIGV